MKNLFYLLVILLTVGCSSIDQEVNPLTQIPVDVYIAGQKNNQACYWKNNQETLLVSGENARADTLIISNTNLHILGKRGVDNWSTEYLYWNNNIVTNLSESLSTPGQIVRTITGMDVVGNDVYFVGYTKPPMITVEIYDLVYWKNGIKTVLGSANNPTNNTRIKVVNNTVYVTAQNYEGIEGYFTNGTFTSVPDGIRLNGIVVHNTNAYVFGTNYTQNTAYYKNLNTQNETNVLSVNNGYKLIFDLNDIYISDALSIYKNNNIIFESTDFSYYKDFTVLNGNIYILKTDGDLVGENVLLINNVDAFSIESAIGSFNSITVFQNSI